MERLLESVQDPELKASCARILEKVRARQRKRNCPQTGKEGFIMASLNRVFLIGNLGLDPESSYTPAGTPKATIRLATNQTRANAGGEKVIHTEWHRVIAWGKLAEICLEHLKKGEKVYFEGRLQTRSWEDKKGNRRWITEVIAQEMQMLGGNGRGVSGAEAENLTSSEGDIPF
jgi:single-strand DNA-binding protein